MLVTHDLKAIREHCDRAMLLLDGSIQALGSPADVLARYGEFLQLDLDKPAQVRPSAHRDEAPEQPLGRAPVADGPRRFDSFTAAAGNGDRRVDRERGPPQ